MTTPPAAVACTVPESAPPPDAIDAVTWVVLSAVAGLPAASRSSSTGWVVNGSPATAPAGCVTRTSCAAAPAVTAKLADVAAGRFGAVKRSVRSPAVPLTARSVKVTIPAEAVACTLPERVPPPEAMAAVTCVVLSVVATFPPASRSSSTGWVWSA